LSPVNYPVREDGVSDIQRKDVFLPNANIIIVRVRSGKEKKDEK